MGFHAYVIGLSFAIPDTPCSSGIYVSEQRPRTEHWDHTEEENIRTKVQLRILERIMQSMRSLLYARHPHDFPNTR